MSLCDPCSAGDTVFANSECPRCGGPKNPPRSWVCDICRQLPKDVFERTAPDYWEREQAIRAALESAQ